MRERMTALVVEFGGVSRDLGLAGLPDPDGELGERLGAAALALCELYGAVVRAMEAAHPTPRSGWPGGYRPRAGASAVGMGDDDALDHAGKPTPRDPQEIAQAAQDRALCERG